MTESRILELLMKSANTSHFPKLSPQCVQNISQCISDILYNSLTSNCASQTNYRLDILLLLRQWLIRQKHNFQIDVSNYNCLIDCLVESRIEYVCFDDNMHSTTESEYSDTKPWDTVAEVIEHFTKQQKLHTRQVKLQEIIRNRDQKKCNNLNFSYCNPFTSKISELYNASERLVLLRSRKSCKVINRKLDVEHEKLFTPQSIKKLREKQVQMAWSLLNLDKSTNDIVLLSKILIAISSYKNLFCHEVEFINYLWQNWEVLQVDRQLILILLENFPFIYEREIVKLCKDVLEDNVSDTSTKTSVIKNLLELTKSNKRLLCNIRTIFYELYACSDYNDKLVLCSNLINKSF